VQKRKNQMPENIDDVEDRVEEEDVALDDEEALEEIEPTPEEIAEATVPPEPGLENVESIQDLLAKQETAEGAEEAAADEDEVVTPASTRDERLEPLDARVVPMQETEFMCKNCYLVKHRSQLADKRKMLCRDCA
jgi:Domain of unknown function (DUF4193)